MKVVILCGGRGTRLREETEVRPKPMVAIGQRPILWHIMKSYAHHGFTDFVLALGYKGDQIRDYFLHYGARNNDITVELRRGPPALTVHDDHAEIGWRITLAETGVDTETGDRLVAVRRYLDEQPFMLTYGDGLADLDLGALVAWHRSKGLTATVSAVRPSSRFGELGIKDGRVDTFREKPQVATGWINGGFMVFEPGAWDHVDGPVGSLEEGLLVPLSRAGQLAVYQHRGFWQCMDTYREMELLTDLWQRGDAPWRVWDR